jgi:hypothetical protein
MNLIKRIETIIQFRRQKPVTNTVTP